MKRVLLFALAVMSFSILNAQTDTSKTKTDTASVAKAAPAQEQPRQKRDNRPWSERIALGFGTGFWINTNTTYIELCPVLAYRFPKALVTGVGYRYIYRNQRIVGVDLNSWGPDFFARLQLLRRVYMWTEYEILTSQYLIDIPGNENAKEKTSSDALFAGLGFIRSVGKRGRGGISIQVLYNFFYERDDYSPYYSPVTYRVGYYF